MVPIDRIVVVIMHSNADGWHTSAGVPPVGLGAASKKAMSVLLNNVLYPSPHADRFAVYLPAISLLVTVGYEQVVVSPPNVSLPAIADTTHGILYHRNVLCVVWQMHSGVCGGSLMFGRT